LTATQLAEYLGVSRATIYNLVQREGLPYIRVTGLRFRRSDVDAWLDARAGAA